MTASDAPTRLRYDSLDEALGVDAHTPHLSWQLGGKHAQIAYELEASVGGKAWSSGRVEAAENAFVPYPGPLPASRERVEWRVRVFTKHGASAWSQSAWWERGLDVGDWTARWIEPAHETTAEPGSRPTHLLRTEFELPAAPLRARLHITAHGIYEAWLGAGRVGDAELTPGYTEYSDRLQVQTYDVTDQLAAGTNSLTVELSDGWFRGQVGIFRVHDQWGETTALLAQLEVDCADGSTVVVATGDDWRSTATRHLADIIAGETIDLRETAASELVPGADVSRWNAVRETEIGLTQLVASPAPPVRRVQQVPPVTITRRGERQIVDFGQNLVGWARVSNLGPSGTEITLTFAEALDPAGDVTQRNLEPDLPFMPHRLSAGQVDHLISDGDAHRAVETRHSTHGFRYVAIDGLAHDLAATDITAIVVHTDLRRTGTFACSDDDLNRLHEAALWSFRGNAIDIPTDCPVRERAGWVGDWQIYFPTAAYLYDVAGFSTKWLRDVAVNQFDDGAIANQAPAPRDEVKLGNGAAMNGSSGWGDAIVIVPWEQYQAYGDARVLEEFWPNMVRWIEFVRRSAQNGRHESRIVRNPVALDHERYLWDTGFHWGEWLEPEDPHNPMTFESLMTADKGDVATAYFRRSTHLMAQIAHVLDKPDDAALYAALSEEVRQAWELEFIDSEGFVSPATQANCVRALQFDLVPVLLRGRTADQLARLVRENDNHVATGFLSSGMLLPALADNGHSDVAFALLQQRSRPSWLSMIDEGATTMWERWAGWSPDGQPFESHNHFSKGAVITFLHRYVAGIRPLPDAPGYRRFEISPRIGGAITSAEARLETPHGVIESSFTIVDGIFRIRVVVPPGTTCRLMMPDGLTHGVLAGEHVFATRVAA